MTPRELSEIQQRERSERRLGMSSLDASVIALHFGNAAELRAAVADAKGPRLASDASGTKGACPRVPA